MVGQGRHGIWNPIPYTTTTVLGMYEGSCFCMVTVVETGVGQSGEDMSSAQLLLVSGVAALSSRSIVTVVSDA